MEARHFDLLMLAMLPGLDPRVRAGLLVSSELGEVLARPQDHADRLPPAAVEAVRGGGLRRMAEEEVRTAAAAGVRLVPWGHRDYPALLALSCDPPPMLWVRGAWPQQERGLAIVGSRKATPSGRVLARSMARELAGAGLTIVSGLALGIDGEAHRGALEAGGRTVAVLGSGLEEIYPPAHAALAAQVAREGALVSEFPLRTPPYKANFPRRNRIIAGWVQGVVVVEAAARSGALITARLALDEGREVMAVPGAPGWPTAEGTNALIRDGAVLVRGAADVAEQLGLSPAAPAAGPREPLLDVLRPDVPLGLDELQSRSGLAVPELLQRLSELELERRVQRLPGALFVRGA